MTPSTTAPTTTNKRQTSEKQRQHLERARAARTAQVQLRETTLHNIEQNVEFIKQQVMDIVTKYDRLGKRKFEEIETDADEEYEEQDMALNDEPIQMHPRKIKKEMRNIITEESLLVKEKNGDNSHKSRLLGKSILCIGASIIAVVAMAAIRSRTLGLSRDLSESLNWLLVINMATYLIFLFPLILFPLIESYIIIKHTVKDFGHGKRKPKKCK